MGKPKRADERLTVLLEAAAIDPDLDGVDLRVFLYLCSRLDFENFFLVSQVEMAVMLGRRKEHISRAMRRLEEKGLIIPGPKVGRSMVWQLSAKYMKQ